MSKFLSSKLQGLKPYVPGEQPKGARYVKLNTNESPFPPSPLAVGMASTEASKLMLYPDPDLRELRAELAESFGIEEDEIILTNGSDEVLSFAFMAYCNGGIPALFPDVTYGFYKVFAELYGVPAVEIPLKDNFGVDVGDYENKNGTVFLANPNAPTGLALSYEEIERLVASNTDRIVVVDEAYVDFGGESVIPLVKKYKNLLVTQTFSKSRSMAGARLGYGIACKEIIDDLMRIKYSTNPYNVNRMTAGAGLGSLRDKEYFISNCVKIRKNREWTTQELKKLGFSMTDSVANFIFARSDKIGGRELYLKLKEGGVLVRHFDAPRISDYVRVTVGSAEEMRIFIDTVRKILESI